MSSGAWYLSWLVTLAWRWLEWQSTDQFDWVHSCGFLSLVEGDVAPPVTRENAIDHFIQLELEATISTKANLCSFLPFFLCHARTKPGKKEENNNQFQQIKPTPSLLSHFWCCFFNATSEFIHWTNMARAMHLSTFSFNAFVGFGNCPGGTWKGSRNHPSKRCREKMRQQCIPGFFVMSIQKMDPFFFCLFMSIQKRERYVFDGKNHGDLSTRTPSAIVPPVIASSERAFTTSGS